MERNDNGQYIYWSAKDRIMHIVLFLSAIVAVLTGLPLKYYDLNFTKFIFDAIGSYSTLKLIHNAMGISIIFIVFSHIGTLIFVWVKSENFLSLIQMKFGRQDIDSIRDLLKHLLLFKKKPDFARYSIFAKLDYFVALLSLMILSFTGLLLMFPVASSSFISSAWLTISLHVHSALSVFFIVYILIVHIFNVHVHPGKLYFNTVWITGTLSDNDMKAWHGLEYNSMTEAALKIQEDYKRKSEEQSKDAQVKKEKKMLEEYLSEGNALAMNGNFKEAIVKYKEAIEIYPNYSQARFNLGVAYKKNNQNKEAIHVFAEFISMDPFNEMVNPAKASIKELTKALAEAETKNEETKKDETKDINGQDT